MYDISEGDIIVWFVDGIATTEHSCDIVFFDIIFIDSAHDAWMERESKFWSFVFLIYDEHILMSELYSDADDDCFIMSLVIFEYIL